MTITATAPGKAAIVGEYAVLDGAPALVMAVNRRASVTLALSDGGCCSVTAPGWCGETARFELTAGRPAWLDGGDRIFPLAACVLEAFFAGGNAAGPAFDLCLDSASLMEPGASRPVKLGLGSSAAVTVALWQALSYHAASQHDGSPPDLAQLIGIHSAFQGTRGSGLDIAASLRGGLTEYRCSPAPDARGAVLPADVRYCFVWSGHQAATGSLLARIDRWRREDARQYASVMAPLMEVAEAAARAARQGAGEDFLRLLDDYVTALEQLGNAAGMDILSGSHRCLREIARRFDVVYKPCGAGSGDVGVGMSRDPAALDRFRSGASTEGFLPLSLDIDQDGVRARSGN